MWHIGRDQGQLVGVSSPLFYNVGPKDQTQGRDKPCDKNLCSLSYLADPSLCTFEAQPGLDMAL